MKQFFIFAVLLIIAAYGVIGATVYGSIYDISLNKVPNVKVEINTDPKQTYIAKNGSYSFEIPPGLYELKGGYYQNNILISSTSENITVKNDGEFVVDLILFPSFQDEEQLMQENIDVQGNIFEEQKNIPYWILGIVFLIIVVLAVYSINKKRKQTVPVVSDNINEKPQKEETSIRVVSSDLEGIIKILKEEGGRTTQKDIRKRIPLSEAKISLMISELESKGIVKRIKKGRGNIIILNQ